MATINVYLNFNGNCKEVFEFYKEVFHGEFIDLNYYKEMPQMENMPPLPEEFSEKIMHVSLKVGENSILMGSDVIPGMSDPLQVGNNFSISVNCNSKDEADSYFNALSQGGKVVMPLGETFWGAYFGMLNDKFGISWMFNVPLK
jgi:PhnB protein